MIEEKELYRHFRRLSDMSNVDRAAYLSDRKDLPPVMVSELKELLDQVDAQGLQQVMDTAIQCLVSREVQELSFVPTDFQSLLASEPMLHKYQLLEKIGEGGMGEVFLVHDTTIHRKAVVKRTKPLGVLGAIQPGALIAEARATGKLNHPNIVTLYDAHLVENSAVLIMEYVSGGTLRSVMDEGSPRANDFLLYASQMAEGLSYAHEQGVLHRDLKPANIMVDERGRVKILDFGLAKVLQQPLASDLEVGTDVETLAFKGTMAYMAPEQLRGEAATPASDIFALGILFFEWLAQEPPFCGKTVGERLEEMRDFKLSYLPALHKSNQPDLRPFLGNCLAFDPARRIANGQKLAEALAGILHPPQARTGQTRRQWMLTLAGGALGTFGLLRVVDLLPKSPQYVFSWERECLDNPDPTPLTLRWSIATSEEVPSWLALMAADQVSSQLGRVPVAMVQSVERGLDQDPNLLIRRLLEAPTPCDLGLHFRCSATNGALDSYELSWYLQRRGADMVPWPGLEFQDAVSLAQALDRLFSALGNHLALKRPFPPISTPHQQQEKTWHQYYQGRWFYEDGKYDKALNCFVITQSTCPQFFWGTSWLAKTYSAMAKRKQAWDLEIKLKDRNDLSDEEWAVFQGNFLMESLDYESATKHFESMIQEGGPNTALAYRNMIHCESETGNYQAALCNVKFACAANPVDPSNFALGCFALVESNRFQEAVFDIQACARDFGPGPLFDWALGLAYLGLGNDGSAKDKFVVMKQRSDPFSQILGERNLAAVAMTQGQWKEAIKRLESAMERLSKESHLGLSDGIHCWLARLFLIQGKPARAKEALSMLKIEDRGPIPPHFRLLRDAALIYAELQDEAGFTHTLGLLKTLAASSNVPMIAAAPALAQAVDALAKARSASNPGHHLGEALYHLQQTAGWPDVWTHWYTAQYFLQQGLGERARDSLAKVLEKKGYILYREFPALIYLAS